MNKALDAALIFFPCCFRYAIKHDNNIAHVTLFFICTIYYEPCTLTLQVSFPFSFLPACTSALK